MMPWRVTTGWNDKTPLLRGSKENPDMQASHSEATPRVWFVTGASGGFGRAISEAALDHGDRLVATGRTLDTIQGLVDAQPEHALALQLDVTDPDAARAVVDGAVAHFGRVDVVVNIAG
jgi:NADP-dependent 3-hydroxy acid dehydrogenase YdfG